MRRRKQTTFGRETGYSDNNRGDREDGADTGQEPVECVVWAIFGGLDVCQDVTETIEKDDASFCDGTYVDQCSDLSISRYPFPLRVGVGRHSLGEGGGRYSNCCRTSAQGSSLS